MLCSELVQRSATGLYRKAIEFINERQANNWVISVDIPTGVDSNTGNVANMAVEADYCFTMELPKVGHVLPPEWITAGIWWC